MYVITSSVNYLILNLNNKKVKKYYKIKFTKKLN